MKYEIDLDLKILNTIKSELHEKINISDLKNYIGVHSSQLEYHLEQLVKWGMIVDIKPDRNGKARIINLAKSHDLCIKELFEIKRSLENVNKYFSK